MRTATRPERLASLAHAPDAVGEPSTQPTRFAVSPAVEVGRSRETLSARAAASGAVVRTALRARAQTAQFVRGAHFAGLTEAAAGEHRRTAHAEGAITAPRALATQTSEALPLVARRLVAPRAGLTRLPGRTASGDILTGEGDALALVTAPVGTELRVARRQLSESHPRLTAEREGDSQQEEGNPDAHSRPLLHDYLQSGTRAPARAGG